MRQLHICSLRPTNLAAGCGAVLGVERKAPISGSEWIGTSKRSLHLLLIKHESLRFMKKLEDGTTVETPTEARQAERGPSIFNVLLASNIQRAPCKQRAGSAGVGRRVRFLFPDLTSSRIFCRMSMRIS
jgi:hypothetical protein